MEGATLVSRYKLSAAISNLKVTYLGFTILITSILLGFLLSKDNYGLTIHSAVAVPESKSLISDHAAGTTG